MLALLPQLAAVAIGVHSCWGSELDSDYPDRNEHFNVHYPDTGEWQHFLHLPLLGGVAALTSLYLAGRAALPPDFRQLRHLSRLTVVGGFNPDDDADEFE